MNEKKARQARQDAKSRPDAGLVQDHDEVDLTQRIREENEITTAKPGDTDEED